MQQTLKAKQMTATNSGLQSAEATQPILDMAALTAKKAFLMPKKMASELTPNELKMMMLNEECEKMRAQFEKNKDNIRKIQTIIRYKPITHLVRAEDLDSDDELTDQERFLLNLNQVRSKISHIWRPKGEHFNRKGPHEVRVKNLDSGPTPEDND